MLGSRPADDDRARPNRPGELELKFVQNADKISRGDQVVTAGSTDLQLQSFYPRDILIGTVSKIEPGDGNLDSRIHVKPAVDLGDARVGRGADQARRSRRPSRARVAP